MKRSAEVMETSPSSSSSAGGGSMETPNRKRAKFDENNLDWLIGDLRKEEAQLVITRLTKDIGDEAIRKQIDIVRHAREQYTAEQIRQQVEFFAQLRKLQETPTLIRAPVFDADMSSVLMTPMHGQGMMETPVAASRHPPLSNARIKGIQSRISNAFKKDGRTFHIQEDTVDEEVAKAKDLLSRNNHADALRIMEAVTEEIVQRASPIAINVDNLREIVDWLGKEWIDIFLSSLFEMTDDEKEDWFEKLRTWDTLFSDEESFFTCARFAARHMWNHPKLLFILNGGHNDTAAQRIADGMSYQQMRSEIQQIIGFKEPMNLVTIRLTWLEREKKVDQALNFALALGLFENAAKYQIKLNSIASAMETTSKIKEVGSLFAVAQIAKPVNSLFAFDLVLKAITHAYLEAIDTQAKSLSGRDSEIILWAVGLAESNGKVEEFVGRLSQEIKSKEFLMHIVTLLTNRDKPLMALDLGEKVLPAYSLEELQTIFNDLRKKSVRIQEAWESQEQRLLEEQKASFLHHRSNLLKLLPFCSPVKNLPNHMYKIASAMILAIRKSDSIDERNIQKEADLNDRIRRMIHITLENADDMNPLQLLLRSFNVDLRYEDSIRTGIAMLNIVQHHKVVEQAYMEKRTRDKFEFDEQRQKELQERLASNVGAGANVVSVFLEQVRDHPKYDYDRVISDVFVTIVEAGLQSLRKYSRTPSSVPLKAASNQSAYQMDIVEEAPKETEEEQRQREALRREALSVLESIASKVFEFIDSTSVIIQLANAFRADCLRISLSLLKGCFELIRTSRFASRTHEDVRLRLSELEKEIQVIVDEKQKPSQDQLDRRRELRLAVALQAVIPAQSKISRDACDSQKYQVGQTILNFAISSLDGLHLEPLSSDEIFGMMNLVLDSIQSPQHLLDIGTQTLSNQPLFAIYYADKVFPWIADLFQRWTFVSSLEIERDILVEEQSDMQGNFKKDLDEPQLNRLNEVLRLMKAAVEESEGVSAAGSVVTLPSYVQGKNAAFFYNAMYNLIHLKLKAVLHRRNQLILAIETPVVDRTSEQEEKLRADLEEAQGLLATVFQGCLEQLSLSSQYVELMNFFAKQSDISLSSYAQYAERDILLLLTLLEKTEIYRKESAEIEQNELVKIDLAILEEDARALWAEMQNRQMMSAEQRDRLRALKFEVRLFREKFSGTDVPTLQSVSLVRKNLVRKIASITTSLSATTTAKYRAEHQALEELLVQAATENTPSLCQRQSSKLEALQGLSVQFSRLLGRVVDHVVCQPAGPGTIRAVIDTIAKQIDDCNLEAEEGNVQEFATLQLLRLSDYLHESLQEIDRVRKERLGVVEEVERLRQEQSDSVALRKPFAKESLETLKRHKRQIRIWESGLSSLNLTANEILQYTIDTALVIGRNVLERKTQIQRQIARWRSHLGADAENEMGDGNSLIEYYRKRASEDDVRLQKLNGYWNLIGGKFFDWLVSPAHAISFMEVIREETDLTIQFAQANFAKLREIRSSYEEHKPVREELERLLAEKAELLAANKSLRPDEMERLKELVHIDFVWKNEPSYLHLPPSTIMSLNQTNSELLLRAIFSKISKLQDQVNHLTLLLQDPPPQDLSMVRADLRMLSNAERVSLLATSQDQLKEAIDILNAQLQACFPYISDPEHLISTARMCKRAGQLDSTVMVCVHAISKIVSLEEKREEYSSTLRLAYIMELEKFFSTEFRIPFEDLDKLDAAVKEADALEAIDLSIYKKSDGKGRGSASKRKGRSRNDLVFTPLTLANASWLQSSPPHYLQRFYEFLESVSAEQELSTETLHFRIGRYAEVSTDNPNFPEDRAAAFVHSQFMQHLRSVYGLMIGSIVEKRNILKNMMAEKRKFELQFDEQGTMKQIEEFNREIMRMTTAACEHIDDLGLLGDLLRELMNLDGRDVLSRLEKSEFELSIPICEMYLKKVVGEAESIREYEPKILEYIRILSEEVNLNQQRKELDGALMARLRDLRSEFAELFTFLPCHRMSLRYYRTLAFDIANDLVVHLLEYKREKEEELETMVRQPRLVRGRSMDEKEIQKEFADNKDHQEELRSKIMNLVTHFVHEASNLVQIGRYLFDSKEYHDAILISGKAQDYLKLQLAERLRYEALMKQLIDHSESQLVTNVPNSTSEDAQELIAEIEKLRHHLKDEVLSLRQSILRLADIMIDSARVEGLSDVIEAQSILVFKMEMTVSKFEEVHTLVGEEKWNAGVRSDLLSYVHSYDPTLPGSPIRLTDKIELLIREGWWREAMEHRPEPSAADASESIEVLKLLWFAVEKHSPKDLGKLVSTIEGFTVKEFQKFNQKTMAPLLDVMQTLYPRVVYDLYVKGSDIFISNTASKKYQVYVEFLSDMKARLLTIGMVAEWTEFIASVRRKEIRKKVLINLLNVNDL